MNYSVQYHISGSASDLDIGSLFSQVSLCSSLPYKITQNPKGSVCFVNFMNPFEAQYYFANSPSKNLVSNSIRFPVTATKEQKQLLWTQHKQRVLELQRTYSVTFVEIDKVYEDHFIVESKKINGNPLAALEEVKKLLNMTSEPFNNTQSESTASNSVPNVNQIPSEYALKKLNEAISGDAETNNPISFDAAEKTKTHPVSTPFPTVPTPKKPKASKEMATHKKVEVPKSTRPSSKSHSKFAGSNSTPTATPPLSESALKKLNEATRDSTSSDEDDDNVSSCTDSSSISDASSTASKDQTIFAPKVFVFKVNEQSQTTVNLRALANETKNKASKLFNEKLSQIKTKKAEILDLASTNAQKFIQISNTLEHDREMIAKARMVFDSEIERLFKAKGNPSIIAEAYQRELKRATELLPMYSYRMPIIEALQENDIIIVVGETGSGKSTQLPQYLLEAGFAGFKMIACTQPRKIAAMSLAKRVSQEMNCSPGNTIISSESLHYLYKNKTGKCKTKLRFITDKSLLNEMEADKTLSKYSCVIVDEAHERSLHTDVLLCGLKQLVQKRKNSKSPLKLIITSATLDELAFVKYFQCPLIKVPGRLFPVKVVYDKMQDNYLEQAKSKIIFSTNIAETSVTIDGVGIVVDTGRAKDRIFDQKKNTSILKVSFVSQSAAIQRQGRCGRTNSGTCYRLYEENDFLQMNASSIPELNLGVLILQLLKLGVQNVLDYSMIDTPPREDLQTALQQLQDLQLVTQQNNKYSITVAGELASELFLDPPLARLVIEGIKCDMIHQVCGIAAILPESHRLFKRKVEQKEGQPLQQDASLLLSKVSASQKEGDVLSYYSIFDQVIKETKFKKRVNYKQLKDICHKNQWSTVSMSTALQVYSDIHATVDRFAKNFAKKKKISLQEALAINSPPSQETDPTLKIISCICSGYYKNVAFYNGKLKDGSKVYKLLETGQEVCIHGSSSVLFLEEDINIILFTELMRLEKLYAKNITPISLSQLKSYYSDDTLQNISIMQAKLKTPLQIPISDSIRKELQTRNGERLEQIENHIGYIVSLENDYLLVEVPKDELSVIQVKINHQLDAMKQRLKNELFEYRPDNSKDTRVLYQSGLEPSMILLNFEYIRINLKNIPSIYCSTPQIDTIEKLFKDIGPLLDFRLFPSAFSTTSGYVVFANAADAKKAFEKLNNHVIDNEAMMLVPSASVDGQDCMEPAKLNVKWFTTPSEGKGFVEFENETDAFNFTQQGKSYLPNVVLNQNMAIRNVVYIEKLDLNEDEITLKKVCRHFGPTKNVEVHRKPLGEIEQGMNTVVALQFQSLFEQYGKIESLDLYPPMKTADGKSWKPFYKAVVRFKSPESVEKALQQLDNKNSDFGYGKLHLDANYKDSFVVPTAVANHFKLDLNSIIRNLFKQYNSTVEIKELPSNGNKKRSVSSSVVKIVAQSKKNMQTTSFVLAEFLKPVALQYQINEYKLLLNNCKRELETGAAIYGVCIQWKDVDKTIELYGTSVAKEKLKQFIDDLVEKHEINKIEKVDVSNCMRHLIKHHLQALQKQFQGLITLDVKSKSIQIKSNAQERKSFKVKIEELKNASSAQQSGNEDDCSICFCPVEVDNCFTLTNCGHKFCKPCIQMQMDGYANTVEDVQNGLACVQCSMKVAICDIKCLCENDKTLRNKAQIILNKYLMGHIREYKHCPKCNHILRINQSNQTMHCDSCQMNFCAECGKNNHPGKPCRSNDDASLELIRANFTQCGRCRNYVQKEVGSDHISCRCGAQFCYRCGFLGTDGNSIYTHMYSCRVRR